jgi:TRAP-type C4-dicarboxylate transport system permease large subunit
MLAAPSILRGQGTPRTLIDSMTKAASTSGMIFLILVGAFVFNDFVETSGLPQLLVARPGPRLGSARGADHAAHGHEPLHAVGDLSLRTIVRGILPFILADLVRLAILLAIPAISLWLPARMQ